jgi:hypothetical protein
MRIFIQDRSREQYSKNTKDRKKDKKTAVLKVLVLTKTSKKNRS